MKTSVLLGSLLVAVALTLADELLLTEVDADFDADAYFPPWNRADFQQTSGEDKVDPLGLRYRFTTYTRLKGRPD